MATLVETVNNLVQQPVPTASEVQQAPGRHHPNENIIPAGAPDLNDTERPVYLLGRMVGPMRHDTELVGLYNEVVTVLKTDPEIASILATGPSPAYHWAVGVGDYVHQLQSTGMFGDAWNYYSNIIYDQKDGGWDRFEVGTTRFNDISVKDAATEAMNEIPEQYNIITNNCQNYALHVVDKIIRNGREQRFLTANGFESLEIDKPSTVLAEKLQPTVATTEIAPEPQTVEVAVTEDPEAMRADLLNVVSIMAEKTPVLPIEELQQRVE